MTPSRLAAALFVSILFAADVAVANPPNAPPPGPGQHQGPCIPDLKKFCPNVPLGGGRRIACLAKHQSQLAPTCAKRVPVLQALFEFGKKQQERLKEVEAKEDAAEAAKAKVHPSPPTSKPK
jgi:hypothetical protein